MIWKLTFTDNDSPWRGICFLEADSFDEAVLKGYVAGFYGSGTITGVVHKKAIDPNQMNVLISAPADIPGYWWPVTNVFRRALHFLLSLAVCLAIFGGLIALLYR